MSNDLEKLKAALKDVPEADSTARKRAIDAGMAAFEKEFQGSTQTARPNREQAQWWVLISRGVKTMLHRLTTRQTMLATASLATIAVAVVLTGQFTETPWYSPAPKSTVTTSPGDKPAKPIGGSAGGQTATDELKRADIAPPPVNTPTATLEKEDQSTGLASLAERGRRNEATIASENDAATVTADAVTLAEPMMEQAAVASSPAPALRPAEKRRLQSVAGIVAETEAPMIVPEQNTERFANAETNPLRITKDDPVSTFSIDVDTASYSYVRSALMGGQLPNADAVRTEELINYFSYAYPVPDIAEAPFSTSVSVFETPWNPGTKLLHIAIKGYELAAEDRPPVNLVFLIDTSGSMQDANKLPLLINSFRLLLNNLQPDDKVAIVTYAGSAGTVLEPTPASESRKILDSLERLHAGGSTAGQAGLQKAYALAEDMARDGAATSRVILATDGDFNVGISDPEALKTYVEDKRETGVYLSVLGFGRGNYNDALMQTLAQNGNGQAAYIDTLAEAQKVLVDQIGGALFPIAQDVKIQVEFNPAEIAEYRLIGYETRALAREDFNNDAVDAGEIGAGHSVTAIYEITPVGSPAIMTDDLRYATEAETSASNGEYAFLKLRYKTPGEATSKLITTPIRPDADAGLGTEVQFAAAVAGFGQILRGDDLMRGWTIRDARELAEQSKGADAFGYRAEFVTLLRLAESLK